MARKGRKRRQTNTFEPGTVRQNLEKGNVKAALKQAKVCFRRDSSHKNRELLERAFLARVEQLHKLKMMSEAKAVLKELVDFGPNFPPVVERLPRLRVLLGESGADAKDVLESDPRLLTDITDQAILHHHAEVPDYADVRSEVTAVRDALAAIERGEDPEANRLLATISRNSPLADWRLFARGLIAFYHQDATRAQKNWGRLDPDRPGSRIARTLLVAAGLERRSKDGEAGDLSKGLRQLDVHTRGDKLVDLLKRLAASWNDETGVDAFFRQLRTLRRSYLTSHETLIRKVVDLVWKRAVRDGAERVIDELARIGPAPVVDPHWWRARALVREHPELLQSFGGWQTLVDAWKTYAKELPELDGLRESDRPIAVALVYHRLGNTLLEHAHELEGQAFAFMDRGGEEQELREAAAKYFRQSIDAYAGLRDSYHALVKLHEEDEDLQSAAHVMEQLAAAEPDCFDAALWLAHYHLSQDDPGRSEPHVRTVKRLRPRDPVCETLAWNQGLTMVRCLTVKRQFEAARHELQQLVKLAPPEIESYTIDLLRAGIDFKAKNTEAANTHVQAAINKVEDPTPVWMQMSGTAARMRVAREFKKDFDNRFKAGIKQTPSSVSAGRMARFLVSMRQNKGNYTGRATQQKLLLKSLGRLRKIKWNEGDLRQVCWFLSDLPREQHLFEQAIEVGGSRFPEVPHYHYWAGVREWEQGPYFCNLDKAVTSFQRAIDLHQEGDVELTDKELERARSLLSILQDCQQEEQMRGYRTPHFIDEDDSEFGTPPDFFGMADDDDDETEFSELDGPAFAALVDTMPPDVRRVAEGVAKSLGISVEEVVRRLIRNLERGDADNLDLESFRADFDVDTSTATKKKFKKAKKTKKAKARRAKSR